MNQSRQVLAIATQVMVMAIMISVILLFVGIGIWVLIHVCLVGRTFRTAFGNGNSSMAERGSLGTSISMSHDDVEKLPCFDFKAKSKGSSPVDCAICLENFKAGDKCRLLPVCNHSFHAQCVDLWLLRTPICPICRAFAHSFSAANTTGTSHRFSESGIENLRGSETTEIGGLGDGSTAENSVIRLSESQTMTRTSLGDGDAAFEPQETRTTNASS